ncbi:MAG: DsbC family protein [Azoarcus sp.]|jgi:thiol:disulfide interchange protein DsbC|nr:DsbC family protein [Azoarcus sp.]
MPNRKQLFFLILFFAVAGFFYSRPHNKAPLSDEEALQAVLLAVESRIAPDALPLDQAIKQVRGNGELVLVSFEDPNCPYCAELDQNISRISNITHYTFLLPILSKDSTVKSKQIWCAPDPASAWNNWMLNRTPPTGPGDCDTSALDRNLRLREKLGIRGVPYLLRVES